MSFGASKSDSSSESGSQFNQDVWKPQGDALQGFWNQLGPLFQGSINGMQSQTPDATNWMNQVRDQSNPAWQQQMQGGAFAGMNLQGNYNQALQGGGNEQFIDQSVMGGQGNNYLDVMKNSMRQDANNVRSDNLRGLDARAAASQMSGSDAYGQAVGRINEDVNRDLQRNMSNVGYNTFDKDLDRKLGIAQRADTFDMNKINNASNMLGQQNQAMQGGLNYGQNMQNLGMGAFAPYQQPWQTAGAFGSILGNPTVLGSGNSTASSDSDSFGFGFGL